MRLKKVIPSPGNGPPRFYVDDVEVAEKDYRKAESRQARRRKRLRAGDEAMTTGTTTWPLVSEALGVLPHQVAEANERARRHGIAAEYLPNGDCKIADRAARKKLLKLEGAHDRIGGYGD